MIFRYLQAITSGPRYLIKPKNLDGATPEERNCTSFSEKDPHHFIVSPQDTGSLESREKRGDHVYQLSPGNDYRLCWELIDPGALHLASTCCQLFDIYLSSAIASNLVIEIPNINSSLSDETLEMLWGADPTATCDDRREGVLKRLRRVKEGRRRTPLTRFMLDHSSDTGYTQGLWKDVVEVIDEVFGDELLVVSLCYSTNVHRDFRELAPFPMRYLEAFENPLVMRRAKSNTTCEDQLQLPAAKLMTAESASGMSTLHQGVPNNNGTSTGDSSGDVDTIDNVSDVDSPADKNMKLLRNEIPMSGLPTTQEHRQIPRIHSPPLDLHIYIGNAELTYFERLLELALTTFGKRTVQSLYLSGDHNYDDYWTLLTMVRRGLRITATLKDLTLDCFIDTDSLTDLLRKPPNLERIDLEMIDTRSDGSDRLELRKFLREECLDKEGNMRDWDGEWGEGLQGESDGCILPEWVKVVMDEPRWDWDELRQARSKR